MSMKGMTISVNTLRIKFNQIKQALDEKAIRLYAAAEANALGYGGVTLVHEATGLSMSTIRKGQAEIEKNENKKKRSKKRDGGRKKAGSRIRKKGGGKKSVSEKNPEIKAALEDLIEPYIKGNPESPLLWTTKACRKLAAELNKLEFKISHVTVRNLLINGGYSLQSNRKDLEGKKSEPDRNAQFEHINNQAATFLKENQPVISVDTKKKELIGNFKNGGREYHKKGEPIKVQVHDFPEEGGKVAPYGVYDIGNNKGWVSVGITSDTSEFAVNTIRSWWRKMGKQDYPNATKLMITADCGGSNGNRVRLWKTELQKLANELNMSIHVCHFPPGTSKWNKIEHKMFSYISINWRGVPLVTTEAVVQLISNTTTTKGLQIKAQLDRRTYKPGKEVDKETLKKINITADKFHGEWNYIISPQVEIEVVVS